MKKSIILVICLLTAALAVTSDVAVQETRQEGEISPIRKLVDQEPLAQREPAEKVEQEISPIAQQIPEEVLARRERALTRIAREVAITAHELSRLAKEVAPEKEISTEAEALARRARELAREAEQIPTDKETVPQDREIITDPLPIEKEIIPIKTETLSEELRDLARRVPDEELSQQIMALDRRAQVISRIEEHDEMVIQANALIQRLRELGEELPDEELSSELESIAMRAERELIRISDPRSPDERLTPEVPKREDVPRPTTPDGAPEIPSDLRRPVEEVRQARDASEIHTIIQERQAQIEEIQRPNVLPEVAQHQNQIRVAAHSLLAMENLTGPFGLHVAEVARDFDNSVQATEIAESRIKARGSIARFFIGGDSEAAETIQAEIARNRERLQQLEQIHEDCEECDEEIKAIMKEQIETLQEEQTRLKRVAEEEKARKGIFSFLVR